MAKDIRKHFTTPLGILIASGILLAVWVLTFLISALFFSSATRRGCYNDLSDAALQTVEEVRMQFSSDEAQLRSAANLLSMKDISDIPSVLDVLSCYKGGTLISAFSVLRPDNHIISVSGLSTSTLSYKEEAAKGEHLSGTGSGVNYVLRSYMPIVDKDGRTVALLYGVIYPQAFERTFHVYAFGGGAHLFLVDSESETVLVNPFRRGNETVSDLLRGKVTEGGDLETIRKDIAAGKSGNFSLNASSGKYFVHYESVNICNLSVLMAVEENAVLARETSFRLFLWAVIVVVLFFAIIYGVYLSILFRRNNMLFRKQYDVLSYISKVEDLLFNAHRHDYKVSMALCEVATVTRARGAFLLVLKGEKIDRVSFWSVEGTPTPHLSGLCVPPIAPYWFSVLVSQKQPLSLVLSPEHAEETALLQKYGFSKVIQLPVLGSDGSVIGVLGVADADISNKTVLEMLDCVRVCFSNAIRNTNVHLRIEEMGSLDYVTGMRNRNSYFAYLKEFNSSNYHSLACVYLDVNGLHDINNLHGHEVGDHLLRMLGSNLLRLFDGFSSFRLGGDEFLLVLPDLEQEEILGRLQRLRDVLAQEDYTVSLGIEFRTEDMVLEDMVCAADKKMLKEKAEYHHIHHAARSN